MGIAILGVVQTTPQKGVILETPGALRGNLFEPSWGASWPPPGTLLGCSGGGPGGAPGLPFGATLGVALGAPKALLEAHPGKLGNAVFSKKN